MSRQPRPYRFAEWVKVPRICSLVGCDRVSKDGRVICETHRNRMRRFGSYSPVFVCPRCGTSFAREGRAGRRVFCSKQCRKEPEARACRECGVPFTSKCGSQLCSDACRKASNRVQQRVWNAEYRPATMHVRVGQCPRCGAVFEGYENKVYCTPVCASRSQRARTKARRRARKAGAYVEDVWRSRVYERDGYVCQLCHKAVRMDKEVPHSRAPTLDHVIPLAGGGMHEYANVQLAHFICNSRKSDGDAQLFLDLMGAGAEPPRRGWGGALPSQRGLQQGDPRPPVCTPTKRPVPA